MDKRMICDLLAWMITGFIVIVVGIVVVTKDIKERVRSRRRKIMEDTGEVK